MMLAIEKIQEGTCSMCLSALLLRTSTKLGYMQSLTQTTKIVLAVFIYRYKCLYYLPFICDVDRDIGVTFRHLRIIDASKKTYVLPIFTTMIIIALLISVLALPVQTNALEKDAVIEILVRKVAEP
ncbi:hypothetical protein CHS0354_039703 [Potamilus streckersoni]|uniref:Uncharacterized protein n=1 Tax=Potamilus streckersoni TaxID=2493646 RepID=A0AAE0SEQ3_9BIVA|nr:hypothetical protein CHS0354_039703 [Potamilus streckersoni]